MQFRKDASEEGSEFDASLITPDSEEESLLYDKMRRTDGHLELEDIFSPYEGIAKSQETGILKWLERVYKTSRGFEIGIFDATIFPIIFKKQSENWEPLALGYISNTISDVHRFIVDLMTVLCSDKHVQRGIISTIIDLLVKSYKKSLDHANFVLAVE